MFKFLQKRWKLCSWLTRVMCKNKLWIFFLKTCKEIKKITANAVREGTKKEQIIPLPFWTSNDWASRKQQSEKQKGVKSTEKQTIFTSIELLLIQENISLLLLA